MTVKYIDLLISYVVMNKVFISHPDRKPGFITGAYSDAILVDKTLFVSGQASVDFNNSKFVPGTIEEETKRTMDNIKAIVEAAGGSMNNIVKVTTHLAAIDDFERYNKVYATYFDEIKPARTTVQSVLAKEVKVEIDCIAELPDKCH